MIYVKVVNLNLTSYIDKYDYMNNTKTNIS
jgi:hypothetical protein